MKSKDVVASTYIKCRVCFTAYKIAEYSLGSGRIQNVITYVFVDIYIEHFDIPLLQYGEVSCLKAFAYFNKSIGIKPPLRLENANFDIHLT